MCVGVCRGRGAPGTLEARGGLAYDGALKGDGEREGEREKPEQLGDMKDEERFGDIMSAVEASAEARMERSGCHLSGVQADLVACFAPVYRSQMRLSFVSKAVARGARGGVGSSSRDRQPENRDGETGPRSSGATSGGDMSTRGLLGNKGALLSGESALSRGDRGSWSSSCSRSRLSDSGTLRVGDGDLAIDLEASEGRSGSSEA